MAIMAAGIFGIAWHGRVLQASAIGARPWCPHPAAPAPTENIRLVLPQDSFTAVPGTQLAYYHRGVTPGGPCNYKEILDDAVGMARTLGAHTARVVSLKAPDSYSSCYRIDVLYYR